MKTIFKNYLPALGLVLATGIFFAYKADKNSAVPPLEGFTLIELFTSEGCSSCPSADALLNKIGKESAGKPVYILAYHVDYWDRLGWKDPFSSKAWSQRQSQYSNWFHLNSVYTPQVVVNGKTEFVGSNETRLRSVMATSAEKTTAQLTLHLSGISNSVASLDYAYAGKEHQSLFLATVQKSAVVKVERGENGGRTLAHTNIVQGLQQFPLSAARKLSLTLPKGFDAKTWEIIGFVQDTQTGQIVAASAATDSI